MQQARRADANTNVRRAELKKEWDKLSPFEKQDVPNLVFARSLVSLYSQVFIIYLLLFVVVVDRVSDGGPPLRNLKSSNRAEGRDHS